MTCVLSAEKEDMGVVIAASGRHKMLVGRTLQELIPDDHYADFLHGLHRTMKNDNSFFGYAAEVKGRRYHIRTVRRGKKIIITKKVKQGG